MFYEYAERNSRGFAQIMESHIRYYTIPNEHSLRKPHTGRVPLSCQGARLKAGSTFRCVPTLRNKTAWAIVHTFGESQVSVI